MRMKILNFTTSARTIRCIDVASGGKCVIYGMLFGVEDNISALRRAVKEGRVHGFEEVAEYQLRVGRGVLLSDGFFSRFIRNSRQPA